MQGQLHLGRLRHLRPCSVTYRMELATCRLLKLTLPRWIGRQCSILANCSGVIPMPGFCWKQVSWKQFQLTIVLTHPRPFQYSHFSRPCEGRRPLCAREEVSPDTRQLSRRLLHFGEPRTWTGASLAYILCSHQPRVSTSAASARPSSSAISSGLSVIRPARTRPST